MPVAEGFMLLIGLVLWAIPVAFGIWLFISVNEMKALLRDLRDDVRRIGG